MLLRNKLFLFVLISSFAIVSCESTSGPEDQANQTDDIQTQFATNESKAISAFVFNSSLDVIKGHQELLESEGLGKVSGNGYRVENGWYIWEKETVGEATYDYYKRAHKYFDAEGNLVWSMGSAAGMNFYFLREGTYGYVGDDPSGTSSLKMIASENNPALAMITPEGYLFSSTAKYSKVWDGLYSADGTNYEFVHWETNVDIDVSQLLAVPTQDGLNVSATGTFSFEMEPDWSAEISVNGNDVASGVLMYKGVVVKELVYSVSSLIEYAQNYIP